MRFRNIPLAELDLGEDIRSDVDEEFGGLLESIEKTGGLLQPIIVVPRGHRYELVAGRRRYEAMKARNEATIPAIIRDDLSERDIPLVKLMENVQRKQLTAHELVQIFDEMMAATPGLTKTAIGKMLGKSSTWVATKYKADTIYVQLLEAGVPEECIEDLSEADLRRLGHVKDPEERTEVAEKVRAARGKEKKERVIREAVSFEPAKEHKQNDYGRGGIHIYFTSNDQLYVICESKRIQGWVLEKIRETSRAIALSMECGDWYDEEWRRHHRAQRS